MKKLLLALFLILTAVYDMAAQDVTIKHLKTDQLGLQILEQVENLSDVKRLTVESGTFGDKDFSLLKNTMPQLEHLDLGGISNTELAVHNVTYYSDMTINTESTIRYNLGRKLHLKTLVLPRGLTELRNLGSLPSVEELDVPSSVTIIYRNVIGENTSYYETIDGKSVYYYNQLRRLTLPEGLLAMEENAFYDCDSLREVTLPSTLIKATYAFAGCDSLRTVTCLAPAPPFVAKKEKHYRYDDENGEGRSVTVYSNYAGLFGYDSKSSYTDEKMAGRVLRCPKGSAYAYTMEYGWNMFPVIQEMDADVDNISIAYNNIYYGNFPADNPNMTLACGFLEDPTNASNAMNLAYAGKLKVEGSGTLSLGTFTHETAPDEEVLTIPYKYQGSSNSWRSNLTREDAWATLRTTSTMRADTVRLVQHFSTNSSSYPRWCFTSLPFDCKVSDLRIIEGGSDVQWAIRKYSGQMRADAKFEEVWVKQTKDSTLHAGEGFIISTDWDRTRTNAASLLFTAQNNAQKNRIFATTDQTIALKQYNAQADCDRSWNLVGNPYPCFYSTKYFQPAAPFTVYDMSTRRYVTYSPIDDDYVLAPFQSFFIQRPLGYEQLSLPQYGRFLTLADYEAFMAELSAARHKAPEVSPDRRVMNIVLTADDVQVDRARLVVNPEAKTTYEAGSDATKFKALENQYTLLYIIGDDDTRYAISEQPMKSGERLRLGAWLACDGTYTLSCADPTLTLIDTETGTVQPLSQPFTFTAKAGTCDSRFLLALATAYQNGTTEVDGVEYSTDTNGRAYVKRINSEQETVEIPPYITYESEQYEVYSINSYALRKEDYTYNTAVRHLILPATITQLSAEVGYYDSLQSITLYRLCPPEQYIKISQGTKAETGFTLYVPRVSVNLYKTAPGWWNLPRIEPAETESHLLVATGDWLLNYDDSNKPQNQPDLTLQQDNTNNGSPSVNIDGTQATKFGTFDYTLNYFGYSGFSYTSYYMLGNPYDKLQPTLINTAPVTAEQLNTTVTVRASSAYATWYFFCLPYDLKPADITGNLPFATAFRLYDSEGRAAGNQQAGDYDETTYERELTGNWTDVNPDETIPAGQGFVMNTFTKYDDKNPYLNLTLPASGQTNGIFATTRTITLSDYPSDRAADRGWNLVGNTFPAYYDMTASDIKTPYLVWGTNWTKKNSSDKWSNHYYTYTRDDDEVLLTPFQAFFVQYSDAQKSITLPAEGRYHSYPQFLETKASQARTRHASDNHRQLFDIELMGDNQHDRTRIVLNPEASISYEPTCDAPKVKTAGTAMLYTMEDGQPLSINERPAPTDDITLCLDVATEGDYTLALGKHTAEAPTLTDHLTGTSTTLSDEGYTFHATAGNTGSRFTLNFGNATGITTVKTVSQEASNTYDLQGRRVDGTPKPGIYVRNGQKIIIK